MSLVKIFFKKENLVPNSILINKIMNDKIYEKSYIRGTYKYLLADNYNNLSSINSKGKQEKGRSLFTNTKFYKSLKIINIRFQISTESYDLKYNRLKSISTENYKFSTIVHFPVKGGQLGFSGGKRVFLNYHNIQEVLHLSATHNKPWSRILKMAVPTITQDIKVSNNIKSSYSRKKNYKKIW